MRAPYDPDCCAHDPYSTHYKAQSPSSLVTKTPSTATFVEWGRVGFFQLSNLKVSTFQVKPSLSQYPAQIIGQKTVIHPTNPGRAWTKRHDAFEY